ncbi:hypothetical protein BC939DRAFT_476345 [Gamsiella multidivaricata]|uniref:uncharacterized protein n=1 Tax=Gamsiella multidivaricata TaxID=101098 RepID=UPI002220A2F8|nr:uncharacterized protein BC939DRAFT_476345 [Gamsiella multidivaricata]KAI7825115.1 hypothetical protein BC939DRAFT_476345 [Gamsiella multidivaricata]
MEHQDEPPSTVIRQQEYFDEENPFSFRKKKPSNKRLFTSLNHRFPVPESDDRLAPSSFKQPQHEPSLTEISEGAQEIVSSDNAPPSSSPTNAASLQEDYFASAGPNVRESEEMDATPAWELVWKGSWILPSFEPVTSATSLSSSSRRTPGFLKKASLDNRQQIVFQGRDGTKLKPNVTELPDITFAMPKSQHASDISDSTPSILEEKQMMKENTEMHVIAKISLSNFPFSLLMPGCPEPCRVFVSPESKTSAQFLSEIFDRDDIMDMEMRYCENDGQAVGQIGLLLRLASKSGSNTKRKGMLSNLAKQDDNPFLQPSTQEEASGVSKTATDTCDDHRRKIYQETSMFLVYGVLVDNDQEQDSLESNGRLRTMCFYAYPLVDHEKFLEVVLLNVRSLDRLKQEAEDVQLDHHTLSEDPETYIQYEDPVKNSIMNGCDNEQETGYESDWVSAFDMEVDKDGSSQQDTELLMALERSKSWSPYTVLPPPNTSLLSGAPSNPKDIPSDRILSRSQTLDRVGVTSKDSSARSLNALARHRSMDSAAGSKLQLATISRTLSSSTTPKAPRKGIRHLKSPSRAPQQPLDLTTEGLRRKLLGPESIRAELPSTNTTLPSSSPSLSSSSTKSIEARNKATVKGLTISTLSIINITPDHEDFKECAANLYRSVTFAMRKDIGTRRYHLEELERLMNRHAALL